MPKYSINDCAPHQRLISKLVTCELDREGTVFLVNLHIVGESGSGLVALLGRLGNTPRYLLVLLQPMLDYNKTTNKISRPL